MPFDNDLASFCRLRSAVLRISFKIQLLGLHLDLIRLIVKVSMRPFILGLDWRVIIIIVDESVPRVILFKSDSSLCSSCLILLQGALRLCKLGLAGLILHVCYLASIEHSLLCDDRVTVLVKQFVTREEIQHKL